MSRVKRKRVAEAWRIVSYTIGATLLAFAFLNLGCWLVLSLRDARPCDYLDDFCHQEPSDVARFRMRLVSGEYHGAHLNIDAEGWRVTPSTSRLFDDFLPQRYNIFLLGGSTLFGFGVSDHETIPAHLQGLFTEHRAQGQPIRVYNLGQNAYSSKEEVYVLVDQLKQGRVPDLVVFYDGVNEECLSLDSEDLYRNLTVGSRYQETDLGYFTVQRALDLLDARRMLHVIRLLPVYNLTIRLKGKMAATKPPSEEEQTRYVNAHAALCAQVYLDNVSLVRRLAAAYGFEPVFILQPSGAFLDQVESYHFAMFGAPPRWRRDYYRGLYGAIAEEAKRMGMTVRDLSRAVNAPAARGEPVFLEWAHLTGRGNRYVAEQLYAILADQIHSFR